MTEAHTTFQEGFLVVDSISKPRHKKPKRKHISPAMKKKDHNIDDIMADFYDEDDMPESEKEARKATKAFRGSRNPY